MTFRNPEASIFVPDGLPADQALRRITHLAVGAHQDDSEIMAYHGIAHCYLRDDAWFGAVTCTDGRGSARAGDYAAFGDEDMARLRRREQTKAAIVGNYGALVQLNHSSRTVKDPSDPSLVEDLAGLFAALAPQVVYTHNPADKHDTHLAVCLAVLAALRRVPEDRRPPRVLGCEVWRDLDWLADEDKVGLDVGAHENLAQALVGLYDSQIAGGKRYDLATWGRKRANATYFQSHAVDEAEALWFAMDLTPVVRSGRDVAALALEHVDKFRRDVEARIRKLAPKA